MRKPSYLPCLHHLQPPVILPNGICLRGKIHPQQSSVANDTNTHSYPQYNVYTCICPRVDLAVDSFIPGVALAIIRAIDCVDTCSFMLTNGTIAHNAICGKENDHLWVRPLQYNYFQKKCFCTNSIHNMLALISSPILQRKTTINITFQLFPNSSIIVFISVFAYEKLTLNFKSHFLIVVIFRVLALRSA